ncbi:RWD-domain-containing protein [Violaceomyces palustris]|uniref:RWD-domain-containing protein n=1 Tax=Violaceomyces palustris TaxID=1673888 RepID=A0ACD0NVL4_9BASI|nr:RWD-domain-containing protein [Violaceomyces palustris]
MISNGNGCESRQLPGDDLASPEDLELCSQMQSDEITALESIYGNGCSFNNLSPNPTSFEGCRFVVHEGCKQPTASLTIPIILPQPQLIAIRTHRISVASRSTTKASDLKPNEDALVAQLQAIGIRSSKKGGRARSRHERAEIANQGSEGTRDRPPKDLQLKSCRGSRHAHQGRTKVETQAVRQAQPGQGTGSQSKDGANPRNLKQNFRSSPPHFSPTATIFTPRTQKVHIDPVSSVAVPVSNHVEWTEATIGPLANLPPVKLTVALPPGYPLFSPPKILQLQAPWLPRPPHGNQPLNQLREAENWIRKRLIRQWEEMGGAEVLYAWSSWLSEGMWEDIRLDGGQFAPFKEKRLDGVDSGALNSNPGELKFDEIVGPGQKGQPRLSIVMTSYERSKRKSDFEATSFDCGICLEGRKGRSCVRLSGCDHVFCHPCLSGYISMLVAEGFHRQAKSCPDPECVKMRAEKEKRGEDLNENEALPDFGEKVGRGLLTREELSLILDQTQVERLEMLCLKARAEADPSISYCPREGCQAPVLRSRGDEGLWERFRQCTKCGMSFCAWCKHTWHGPTPCPLSFHVSLLEKYLATEEGSPERQRLENTYGKAFLEKFIKQHEEDQANKKWLEEHATPCPSCGVRIEKSFGCNHMTCRSCMAHFCHICGQNISATNPYSHFNTRGLPCFNKLFDGILGNGDDGGIEGRQVDAEDFIPWEEILDD